MFNIQETKEKMIKEWRREFDLERVQKALSDQCSKDSTVKALQDKVTQLEADLKIAKAEAVQAFDKAKAQYAEHVMSVTDARVAEMRNVYENYAKNIVDIVKASVQPPAATQIVPIVSNTTSK